MLEGGIPRGTCLDQGATASGGAHLSVGSCPVEQGLVSGLDTVEVVRAHVSDGDCHCIAHVVAQVLILTAAVAYVRAWLPPCDCVC